MRRRYTDSLWTAYIKKRDKGLCTVNFKCYKGTDGSDVSHYHGRRKESTRFDGENCDFVCRVCHNFIHTSLGAQIYEEWKLKQLGERRFKLLQLRASISQKRDDYITKIIIKKMIQDLDA
jgi:hypothetical protein